MVIINDSNTLNGRDLFNSKEPTYKIPYFTLCIKYSYFCLMFVFNLINF